MTVIVPTRDRPDRLRVALAALQASLDDIDELIVVDSASRDAAAVAAVTTAAGAILIRCDQPGASRARNAGWQAASHEYIGFVDDDVRVERGWAAAMSACLTAHPEAAFVTGRIDSDGGERTMTVAVKDDAAPVVYGARDGGVLGHSASVASRRDVLQAVGGFDERLGAGGRFRAAEDTDLFDRLLGRGLTGRYEPTARATHEQWRRIRQWVLLQHAYGVGGGARLAKLVRSDRRRLRVAARDDLWTWGVARLPGEVVRGDVFRAVGTLLRLAGVARGFATAIATPVVDGHFRASSNSS
jgi:glycosyltransferase involved in cell wall biosynthesis